MVLIAAEKQEDALSGVPVLGYSETNAATIRADGYLGLRAWFTGISNRIFGLG
jgi:hypothetical protein